MAECIVQKAGGGIGSDDVTVTRADMRADRTGVTADSSDEVVAGAMAVNGRVDASLNCGQSKVVPAGYTPGGTVTAKSLASQTGGVTAVDEYVLNGYTYWRDGVRRTGTMAVSSVVSFSVAAYSVGQVLATWANPPKGPYSGFAICAKIGGYPTGIGDSRVYTGGGGNAALGAVNSAVISGLAAGQTYYFRIWAYCQTSVGDLYSGYQQAACAVSSHGRAAFTSSGMFTVPAGVRSINIHCTGGGGRGGTDSSSKTGNGGGGGYTAYKNNIAVTPGQQVAVTVGAGMAKESAAGAGGTSLAGAFVMAAGGNSNGSGGSGGGAPVMRETQFSQTIYRNGLAGGSDGNDGARYSSYSNDKPGGTGQHVTTREFGTGTLYSGGGGSQATVRIPGNLRQGGAGGAGGGGKGSGYQSPAEDGAAGTGGGGGGGNREGVIYPGSGGSGNVIITW